MGEQLSTRAYMCLTVYLASQLILCVSRATTAHGIASPAVVSVPMLVSGLDSNSQDLNTGNGPQRFVCGPTRVWVHWS